MAPKGSPVLRAPGALRRLGWLLFGEPAYTTCKIDVAKPACNSCAGVWDYSPQEVYERLDRVQLIDVRQPAEHAAGRITGATLIALGELGARSQEIDPARPVVFYCRTGARSGMATEAFRAAGYDAHNMAGGLVAWVAGGLPLEPPDGYVATH